VTRSAGISAGPGGADTGSANPDNFDGIVEDDAGANDMKVDRGLSPAQTLGAGRRGAVICAHFRCNLRTSTPRVVPIMIAT